MNEQSELLGLSHDVILELFELDLNPLGTDLRIYFCSDNQTNETNIEFDGRIYPVYPIEADGFEKTTEGLPEPTLIVSNVFSAISGLLLNYDGLRGAKLTRRRILAKYLNNPSRQYPPDIWFISRYSDNQLVVKFTLRTAFDLGALELPLRTIAELLEA